VDPVTPLPVPIDQPSQIFPFLPPWWLPWLLLGLALLVAMILRARRRVEPTRRANAPAPAPGWSPALDEVGQRALRSRDFRTGCHELGVEVQTWVERTAGRETDALTVAELVQVCPAADVNALALELRDLAYREAAPTLHEFEASLRKAKTLLVRR
jgi:hypothetical protein